jgi:alkanesulfonate monooxygenase SsuD/methylene tetrahydromethanopterin reductase-like flavin-dependent oxidoreductase (luciferase family)
MEVDSHAVGAERAAELATGLLAALVDRDDLSEFERRLDAAQAEIGADPVSTAHLLVAQADLASCLLYLLSVEVGSDQRRVLDLLARTLANLKARDHDLGSRLDVRLRPPA